MKISNSTVVRFWVVGPIYKNYYISVLPKVTNIILITICVSLFTAWLYIYTGKVIICISWDVNVSSISLTTRTRRVRSSIEWSWNDVYIYKPILRRFQLYFLCGSNMIYWEIAYWQRIWQQYPETVRTIYYYLCTRNFVVNLN